MNINKKTFLPLSIIFTSLLLGCNDKKKETNATQKKEGSNIITLKIGHGTPLTGGSARFGIDNDNGAKLAIEDLNRENIEIDGKKIQFELLSEDDASDPKQATQVANKFVDQKVNFVIGHLNSGTTIPASQIYNTAGIPQISPAATNPKYTQQGFKGAFRVVATDAQLGARLGNYAVNELKAKKIAIIDDRTAYGQGVAEEFKKGAIAAGADIVTEQFTDDKKSEFTNILGIIKSKNPDAIFFGGMDEQASKLIRQLKQLGINAKFIGGDGICGEGLGKTVGDSLTDDTVYCAEAGGIESGQKEKLEKFKTRFKQKFNVEVQVYAPYVYDAIFLTVNAIKEAKSTEPAKYLPYLAKAKYDGITGKIEFDEKGDIRNGALTLYTYKGGKRTLISVVR